MPDRRPRHAPAKALVCLFAALPLPIFTAYLADVVVQRIAGAAGSCLMEIEEERVTLNAEPEEGAALALGGDRAALAALVVIFYVATIANSPVDPRPGDVNSMAAKPIRSP